MRRGSVESGRAGCEGENSCSACGLTSKVGPHADKVSSHRYCKFLPISHQAFIQDTQLCSSLSLLSPTHSTSRLGERSKSTKEPAAGREKAVPAAIASEAPASPSATPAASSCSRVGAPPPPAGSREAAAARCPSTTRASGAASRRLRPISAQRTPRPTDTAATVASSRLLHPDLILGAAPKLHCL